MKATLVRRINDWKGDARLYRVEPPLRYDTWGDEDKDQEAATGYVIVSAADVPFSGPETYIFAASEAGDVLDWGELDGSFRGGLDHREALSGAGYEISDD